MNKSHKMSQYGSMTLRERESKMRKKVEEKSQDSSDASIREVRNFKKLNPLPKRLEKSSRAKYDGRGFEKDTGLDMCDCLDSECPGCWMDCPNCTSRKCGHECRVFRRYKYDYIEIEGTDQVIKNKGK